MNPNNYGTLPACQKLIDAGIVLETEHYWYRDRAGYDYLDLFPTVTPFEGIPAPSMAEVWREVPNRTYLLKGNDSGNSIAWIGEEPAVMNTNPTDALIELLILVTKQKEMDG